MKMKSFQIILVLFCFLPGMVGCVRYETQDHWKERKREEVFQFNHQKGRDAKTALADAVLWLYLVHNTCDRFIWSGEVDAAYEKSGNRQRIQWMKAYWKEGRRILGGDIDDYYLCGGDYFIERGTWGQVEENLKKGEFEKAISLSGDSPLYLGRLGKHFLEKGNREQAKLLFDRALGIKNKPDYAEGFEVTAGFELVSQGYAELGDPVKAKIAQQRKHYGSEVANIIEHYAHPADFDVEFMRIFEGKSPEGALVNLSGVFDALNITQLTPKQETILLQIVERHRVQPSH